MLHLQGLHDYAVDSPIRVYVPTHKLFVFDATGQLAQAPFAVYLMHIPGKESDTGAKAAEVYAWLQGAGIPVLYDDREERAGIKFNDADLIGLPLRLTIGRRSLQARRSG